MPHRPPPNPSRYLVEGYRPGLTHELLQQTAHKIGRSAEELSAEGSMVELLLALFVPDDEVVFCLFAANSRASVTQVCRRAELPFHRIAEAISTPPPVLNATPSNGEVSGGGGEPPI
jgi:Protein of unknown function (DUF4242)